MREIKDAATVERQVAVLGDLALEAARTRQPGRHEKPQYFRGALVRSRRS
jgi:hypothetical protein